MCRRGAKDAGSRLKIKMNRVAHPILASVLKVRGASKCARKQPAKELIWCATRCLADPGAPMPGGHDADDQDDATRIAQYRAFAELALRRAADTEGAMREAYFELAKGWKLLADMLEVHMRATKLSRPK